jgi:hypothetical protein
LLKVILLPYRGSRLPALQVNKKARPGVPLNGELPSEQQPFQAPQTQYDQWSVHCASLVPHVAALFSVASNSVFLNPVAHCAHFGREKGSL